MISRRRFLAAACAVPALVAQQSARRTLVLLNSDDAERIRKSRRAARRATFNHLVSDALKAGPWSVTYNRPQGGLTQAGPHDYFSEGPYWWPDPKNPSGPYVRRDGERNPGRFTANHRDMDNVSNATLALGMGAFFLKKRRCIEHANRILSIWFVDPTTRMNPNLEHAQAIRGVNDGRGTGIIDAVSLIRCVQGLALLDAVGGLNPNTMKGVRQWFADLLNWMTTSKKGLDEKTSGNNHATWWTAQVAAYASFLGDGSRLNLAFDHYRTYLVPTEIRPDGSCPREESRTNSLSYSGFNLDAFTVLCRIAQTHGVDLWHFGAPNGASLAQACDYLLPFLLYPASWHHQQIDKLNRDTIVFPALAGMGLHYPKLIDGYKSLPHAKNAWNQLIDALFDVST